MVRISETETNKSRFPAPNYKQPLANRYVVCSIRFFRFKFLTQALFCLFVATWLSTHQK